MADYTTFDDQEKSVTGRTPRWTITRSKSDCGNNQCPVGELGSSTDHGYDPAISSTFMSGVTVDTTVCTFPTHRSWSAYQESMQFRPVITGNTLGTLTVDISFYECLYGSTGAIEGYRLIVARTGMKSGETVQIPNDGGQVLCHVTAFTNADSSASMKVYARSASMSAFDGVGGGDSDYADQGLAGIGVHVWDSTSRKWVRWSMGASGIPIVEAVQDTAADLNCTEASAAAILAKVTETDTEIDAQGLTLDSIQTAVELIDDTVGDHDVAPADAAGTKVLIEALDDPTAAPVVDGDLTRIRGTLNGGAMVAGINAATTQTYDLPIAVAGEADANQAVPTSGHASQTIQAAVNQDDTTLEWNTLNGARVVAGVDTAANLSRNMPVENTNDVASGTGVPVGGVVDTTIPAAAADGDFMPAWMGPQGTVGVHGYDVTNNQPRALPVESGTAVASGIGVPIHFRAETTVPGASGDNTVVQPFATPEGALVVAGVDVTGNVAVNLPVETTDSATNDKGLPVGAEAISGTPTAIGDGDFGLLATDLTRALRVYQSQGSDHTTDSTETWEKPATGVVSGTTQISNAAATALAASSTPCIAVIVQNRAANAAAMAVGDSGIAGVNEGHIMVAGAHMVIEVDDVSKVYLWATNLNDDADWFAVTR